MKIAREASTVVVPFVAAALILQAGSVYLGWDWLSFAAVLAGMLAIGCLLFFRDPERNVPDDPNAIVAPADGKVLLAETTADGLKRVAIFMSVFNVHVNRCPSNGSVTNVERKPGQYFNAATDDAFHKNARVDVSAETDSGTIRWTQISGLVARKITCRLSPGDQFQTGERFGLIISVRAWKFSCRRHALWRSHRARWCVPARQL